MGEILLLGPNSREAERLEQLLKKNRMRVHRIWDPEEGINFIKRGFLDGIYCTFDLAKSNGLEIISQITECDKNIPIVVVNDFRHTRHAAKAVAQGAFDYLPMPLDPEEVKESAKRIVSSNTLKPSLKGIRFEVREGIFIIIFPDEFSFEAAKALNDIISKGLPKPEHGLILDLSETTYISSSGIGSIFLLSSYFDEFKEKRIITGASRRVQTALNLSGIDTEFLFTDSMETAFNLIRKE